MCTYWNRGPFSHERQAHRGRRVGQGEDCGCTMDRVSPCGCMISSTDPPVQSCHQSSHESYFLLFIDGVPHPVLTGSLCAISLWAQGPKFLPLQVTGGRPCGAHCLGILEAGPPVLSGRCPGNDVERQGEFLLGFACEQLGAVLMGESGTEGGEGGKGAVFALCPQCGLGEGRFLWALFLLSCTKI